METRGDDGGEGCLNDVLGEGGGLRRTTEARCECSGEGTLATGGGECEAGILRRLRGDAIGDEGGEMCLDTTEGGLWAHIWNPLRTDGCGEGLRLCGSIEGNGEAMMDGGLCN